MHRKLFGKLFTQSNPLSFSNRTQIRSMVQGKNRFYKDVSVTSGNGSYEINLDQRKLKTPNGRIFQVPNESLAMAVANEWNGCKDKIIPSWMHLTGLSFTVVDNPNNQTKYQIAQKTLEFLETDTILFRDDINDDFIEAQKTHWDPILEWFNKRFEVDLQSTNGLYVNDMSPETKGKLLRYLLSHNEWAVTGFWFGVDVLKSVVLTIAAAERKLSIEEAVSLSRLELNYQTSRWGEVEWSHDIDKYDIEARFAAAIMFIHFNSSNYSTKKKTKI